MTPDEAQEKKLSDLIVGDKVCTTITSGWSQAIVALRVGVVEKVTAAQITALKSRWLRRTGREYGAAEWMDDRLRVWTPGLQAEADYGAEAQRCERICTNAAGNLLLAKGDDAIRLAALLPDELTAKEATP